MKSRLLYIVSPVAFFFLAVLSPTISGAQEIETASHDSTAIQNPEENIYAPQDDRSFDRMPLLLKDSSSIKQPHHQGHQKSKSTQEGRQVERNKEEKEDSVMSFNFLYYIIKKFKLSDIVDNE